MSYDESKYEQSPPPVSRETYRNIYDSCLEIVMRHKDTRPSNTSIFDPTVKSNEVNIILENGGTLSIKTTLESAVAYAWFAGLTYSYDTVDGYRHYSLRHNNVITRERQPRDNDYRLVSMDDIENQSWDIHQPEAAAIAADLVRIKELLEARGDMVELGQNGFVA